MSEFEPGNNPHIDENMEDMPEEEILFDKYTELRNKADEILAELKEEARLEKEQMGNTSPVEEDDISEQAESQEKSEVDEKTIKELFDIYLPIPFNSKTFNSEHTPNLSNILYSQVLCYETIHSPEITISTLKYTTERINLVLPEIKNLINILSTNTIDSHNPQITSYLKQISYYQNELLLLREQLNYKVENHLFLEESSIEEALGKFRLYKSKLLQLPKNSPQFNDTKNVMSIYEQYIKEQFKQSPEKYGLGKSKAFDIDINSILHQFIDTELTKDESFRQKDITENKNNIITELRQTPGIVGVIPMAEGTIGSKNADIMAITLKKELSPDEINNALQILYAQIQKSARSRDINTLDFDNIDLYNQNGRITLSETQSDSTITLSELFQVHLIKVAKRSTDLKYDHTYQPHNQAMAKFSQDWNNPNNISSLSDSFYEKKDDKIAKKDFNRDLFQLSVQDVLNLPLA